MAYPLSRSKHHTHTHISCFWIKRTIANIFDSRRWRKHPSYFGVRRWALNNSVLTSSKLRGNFSSTRSQESILLARLRHAQGYKSTWWNTRARVHRCHVPARTSTQARFRWANAPGTRILQPTSTLPHRDILRQFERRRQMESATSSLLTDTLGSG